MMNEYTLIDDNGNKITTSDQPYLLDEDQEIKEAI